MNEPLRPLNLGEILDRTAEFYRARFLVFFGIAALPSGMVLTIASGTLLVLLWFGANGQALGSRAAAGAAETGSEPAGSASIGSGIFSPAACIIHSMS